MIKFGTGGWRAIIADGFTKENIRLLTAGLCALMEKEGHAGAEICVGYDRRFLSKESAHWACEVLAGYGFGGLEPALQSMAVHSAAPAERGSANSTFLCAYDIGIGLGGGIAGVLISGLGYEQMFVILSAANIVSVLLYVLWGRNDPSSISRSLRIAKDCEKNA